LRKELNAITHVDIFRQELIRDLVFLQDVVVDPASCQCASEKKSEQSGGGRSAKVVVANFHREELDSSKVTGRAEV
jgi:hypothetical protein